MSVYKKGGLIMRERFVKVMLVVISVLLFLNLVHYNIFSAIAQNDKFSSEQSPVQNVTFRGEGIAVACSGEGRYVYAAANSRVFRSTDYGKAGSWEKVLD
jgi:hypothetical protein